VAHFRPCSTYVLSPYAVLKVIPFGFGGWWLLGWVGGLFGVVVGVFVACAVLFYLAWLIGI